MRPLLPYLVVLSIQVFFSTSHLTEYNDPSGCNGDEFFDPDSLRCVSCDDQNLTATSAKDACTCKGNSVVSPNAGFSNFSSCTKCPNGLVPSRDRRFCILCDKNRSGCKGCRSDQIAVERFSNGTQMTRIYCVTCTNGTVPSADGTRCVHCPILNPLRVNGHLKCICPPKHDQVDDVCVPSTHFTDFPIEPKTFTIEYFSGQTALSYMLKMHLRSSMYLCKQRNATACQFLANMCTLVLYQNYQRSPCRLWYDVRHTWNSNAIAHLPRLLYLEDEASIVLNRKKINMPYSLNPLDDTPCLDLNYFTAGEKLLDDLVHVLYTGYAGNKIRQLLWAENRVGVANIDISSFLNCIVTFEKRFGTVFYFQNSMVNFTAVIYHSDGRLKGIQPLTGHSLHLCPGSKGQLDRAFRFAVNYRYSCTLKASELINAAEGTDFIVPYLQFKDNGTTMLHAVPILIKDIDNKRNKERDMSTWQLVHRFFLVDRISGAEMVESSRPVVYRYARSIDVRIRARGGQDMSSIYPPLIVLAYGEIDRDSVALDKQIPLSFSVTYSLDNNTGKSIDIAIGILCGFAVIYSGIQTWSYSRRSGRLVIDLLTLFHLCLISCGHLANAFLLVAVGVCIHTLIFFKGQDVVHILLPTMDIEKTVQEFFIVAFSLKLCELCIMIRNQVRIDIFLIDWERPRPTDAIPRPISSMTSTGGSYRRYCDTQPVSVWRTYFIANEWNEIQTKRRVNIIIHLIITLFVLQVFGVENWSTVDTELSSTEPEFLQQTPHNTICKLAVGCLVYATCYCIQLLFMAGIYERFIKNSVQEFVDLCSMANISVLIFSMERYGYYIHGRSAHGFADTDMGTMLEQLRREEANLCGHRGLLPGSQHQTYGVACTAALRDLYRKLLQPAHFTNFGMLNATLKVSLGHLSHMERSSQCSERRITAYNNMNKLLTAYFEHALRDMDYDIRDKLFTESLLDIEFTDCIDRGILYTDNGHSFDAVLFYGNEVTLFTFDLAVFCFLIELGGSYLLAILLLAITSMLVCCVRRYAGKKNLARKALIDERFLI